MANEVEFFLLFFPAVINYLQMSAGSGPPPPHIGEVEQIYTHKGPYYKSLFLHQAPSVKFTPPSHPIFHQEDAIGKYQFSNYNGNICLHLCVLLFHVISQLVLRNAVWCDTP